MRVELELPDWVDVTNVSIIAGMELVAFKPYGKNWKIKTARCNLCGVCCHKLRPTHPIEHNNGVCVHLERIGQSEECAKGLYRPWTCCWSDPVLTGFPDGKDFCSIRYKDA